MLFQVLCGLEPIFYTTHPNEEPELLSVNGGDKTLYEKVRDFVNNNLGDLVKGIRDGWNGK